MIFINVLPLILLSLISVKVCSSIVVIDTLWIPILVSEDYATFTEKEGPILKIPHMLHGLQSEGTRGRTKVLHLQKRDKP